MIIEGSILVNIVMHILLFLGFAVIGVFGWLFSLMLFFGIDAIIKPFAWFWFIVVCIAWLIKVEWVMIV